MEVLCLLSEAAWNKKKKTLHVPGVYLVLLQRVNNIKQGYRWNVAERKLSNTFVAFASELQSFSRFFFSSKLSENVMKKDKNLFSHL